MYSRSAGVARSYLLHVGGLDWTKINPDIFGSMIQAVAEDEERGELGMHYTSVPNILKVLNPLFLDDLQWADASTIDLVSSLARRTNSARLMIVATYRPGDAARKATSLLEAVGDLRLHPVPSAR